MRCAWPRSRGGGDRPRGLERPRIDRRRRARRQHPRSPRSAIEAAWGARVFDHTGMTEIGAVSFECAAEPGDGRPRHRKRVHRRGDRPADAATVADGRDRRTGADQPRPLGQPADPLPHRRPGPPDARTAAHAAGGSPGWKAVFWAGSTTCSSSAATTCFPPAVEAVLRRFPEVAEFRCHDRAATARWPR